MLPCVVTARDVTLDVVERRGHYNLRCSRVW